MDSSVLGIIRQTAYVVDDLEQVAAMWTETIGAGPFFVTRLDMVVKYRSEERRVGKECRSRWSPYH